jgi:oligoribonuclease (3'-5' exoribonuclease)
MWGGETGEGLMIEEEMKETKLAGGVKRHRESIYEEKKRRNNLIKYTNKWYEKISLSDNIASNPIAEISEFIQDTRNFEQKYGGQRRV